MVLFLSVLVYLELDLFSVWLCLISYLQPTLARK